MLVNRTSSNAQSPLGPVQRGPHGPLATPATPRVRPARLGGAVLSVALLLCGCFMDSPMGMANSDSEDRGTEGATGNQETGVDNSTGMTTATGMTVDGTGGTEGDEGVTTEADTSGDSGSTGSSEEGDSTEGSSGSTGETAEVLFDFYDRLCTPSVRREGTAAGTPSTPLDCDAKGAELPQLEAHDELETVNGTGARVIRLAMPALPAVTALLQTAIPAETAGAVAPVFQTELDCADGEVGQYNWAVHRYHADGTWNDTVVGVHTCGQPPVVVQYPLETDDDYGIAISFSTGTPNAIAITISDPVIVDLGI